MIQGAWLESGVAVGLLLLLSRTSPWPRALDRMSGLFGFLSSAAAASGAGSLCAIGFSAAVQGGLPADAAAVLLNRWLAAFTGIVLVVPPVLLWTIPASRPRDRRGWIETLGLLAVCAAAGSWALAEAPGGAGGRYPVEILIAPLPIIAAIRLGPAAATSAMATLGAIVIWAASLGRGPFAQPSIEVAILSAEAYALVAAVAVALFAAAVEERRAAEARVATMATTDGLTGVANHRRLLDVIRAEISRSQRTRRSFALLVVDVDGLRAINERFGHVTGNAALRRVADVLRRSCRTIDTTARLGGDEFAVVLAETDEAGARVVLGRVTAALDGEAASPRVTVSGGVAAFPIDGDSPTLLLRAADASLAAAKGSPGGHGSGRDHEPGVRAEPASAASRVM